MSQNYNVDDILEEIRRKKTRQPDAPSTYSAPRGGERRPPAGQEEIPPGMPNVRPIGSGTRRASGTQRPRPQRQPAYDDTGWEDPHPSRVPASQQRPTRPQPPEKREASRKAAEYDAPLPRPRETAQPARRTSRGPVEQGYQEPRRQSPYEEQPRRKAADTPARRQEGPYAPSRDTPRPASRRKETPYADPYEPAYAPRRGEAFPPEPEYPGEPAYPPEAYAPEPEYGYEPERFEDDAPSETPTEDFSLHFSLDDDTAQNLEMPDAARDEGEPLVKSQWHQSFIEQELQEQPVPDDDFGSPADQPYVEKDLKKLKTGLAVRIGAMSLLTVLTTYLVFSLKPLPELLLKLLGQKSTYLLPLPTLLINVADGSIRPRIFMTLLLLLCAGGALICANIIGAGFGALFRLRANSDTPAALAVLAVLMQGVILMIYPNQLLADSVSVYIPAAMLVLLFTLAGKLMLAGRIQRNFQFLTSDKEKYAMLSVFNHDFARELSRGLGPEIDEVAYSARVDFITGFLLKSNSGDYSDNFYCVSAPVSFAGALLVGGVTGFLAESPVLAVSAFAATMCVCAPLSSAIVPHLMLGRMSKWLCKRGAMLAGYETAEEIAAAGAVIIDEKEVFPGESVQLHGMKVFAEKRIDEAILDAASVILSCNGLMSGVFLNMIGGNQKMLKKVDGLIYEDGMGVSAWVDGKRVLIGSRELMQNHEVECPSRDFEARYTKGGRRVLYIANSGELSAMFVVSYNGETRTAERLADLERRGVSMILYTTDPNVTAELVASVFGIRKGSLRVLPAKLHPEYNYLTRFRDHVTAGCAHQGGLAGVLQLLRAAGSVCRSVRAGAITQLVGIIAGYGLMVAMAFTNSLSLASFYMIMLYGLCALAVTFLVSNFGKM